MQRFVQKVYLNKALAQRAVRDRVKFLELVEKIYRKLVALIFSFFFRYLMQYRRVTFSKTFYSPCQFEEIGILI